MSEGEGTGAKSLRYVIIGAGMAGILAGIKLKERGEKNIVILEKADSVGGTWRDNRYPGLACDTPSHCYTYSFAPNPDWKGNYAEGPEIRAYFEKVAAEHGINELVRFNSEVTACAFDEESNSWEISLSDGSTLIADVLIAATGVLHHPNIPHLPGMETFSGKLFHSARWDDEAVVDGARVGVIGSGSTAVQIVSALSDRAAQVVQFQRSAQWILPTEFVPFSEAQRDAFRNDPSLIKAIRQDPAYWNLIYNFTASIIDAKSEGIRQIEDQCRHYLETSVRDPALREKLRPNYRAACKRLVISWNYYDAIQKPNMVLETGAIDQITPTGVRMKDGTFHELDVLVLATGFKANMFVRPMNITGRDGVTIDQIWQKRPTAYYAVTVPGFPNLFLLNGPSGPVGNFPLIDIAEREWGYIEPFLDRLRSGESKRIECLPEALEDYEHRRIEAARRTIFASGCSSWYLDSEGVPGTWPWSYQTFADAMEKPRFEDYAMA